MKMPSPDERTISRKREITEALRQIIPHGSVISDDDALRVYESDGLTAYQQIPLVAVLPETEEQVSLVLAYCHESDVKVVPRGAGTSLSGGALPLEDGVLLCLGKLNQIKEVDFDNRCMTVEPAVSNAAISEAVAHAGFYYAPDPSSRIICSVGGNVAENAGGMHCLKYGLTTNNVLGIRVVLMSGEIIRIGGKQANGWDYDLLGLLTGSEGLLGVVTEVTVRILPEPDQACVALIGFPTSVAAGQCVSAIIGAGILPAAMEMMDRLAISAAEDFVKSGYPTNAEALLIIELDGDEREVRETSEIIRKIADQCDAISVNVSTSESERQTMWAGRMSAFPSIGRISPDYYCMDGTIPRSKLPHVLSAVQDLSEEFGLGVANVFHAGDGNLHPLILYDANVPGELERAEAFGERILKLCVDVGGVLTGEHGVGVEKRDLMEYMFSEDDLNVQQRVKCAFDEKSLLNPGKVFPKLHRCAELGRVHVHSEDGPRFAEIPRY